MGGERGSVQRGREAGGDGRRGSGSVGRALERGGET